MKLTDRINVLIQATTLSQKSGTLNLDEAVKAKTAIDIILSGVLNQNFTSAINILIEIAMLSQKKGIYSLKDAHMIYLAIDGFESEFQNEINKINSNNILEYESNANNENETVNENNENETVNENNENETVNENNENETIITIPPVVLKQKKNFKKKRHF